MPPSLPRTIKQTTQSLVYRDDVYLYFDLLESDGLRVGRRNLDRPRVAGDLLNGTHKHVRDDCYAQETPDPQRETFRSRIKQHSLLPSIGVLD